MSRDHPARQKQTFGYRSESRQKQTFGYRSESKKERGWARE